jgi:hypothetical protein
MPTDEAALAELRQANARLAADNRRRLAEIRRRLTALEIAALDRRLKALEDRVAEERRVEAGKKKAKASGPIGPLAKHRASDDAAGAGDGG